MKDEIKENFGHLLGVGLLVLVFLIIFCFFLAEIAMMNKESMIPYSSYSEYGGQKEIGNTNMIYHEFTEGNHTVRVMKNDVFSFERYFETKEEAVLYMENYSEYIRTMK